ncbi:MAG: site-2 protease family protein [Candidatus Aminicenantes bacterium]|nr:site-2 protease family protein [Candidatus Aminicenantes bacterium]
MNKVLDAIIQIGVILFAVSVHEAAHAWMADKCGDPTARRLGRVTLNPIPHIDLVGSILVPAFLVIMSKITGSLFLFGWAKPVPFNPANLRNRRKGSMLIAAAGPGSNLLTAAIAIILFVLFKPLLFKIPILAAILFNLIFINIILAVLNLLPIPPLDGSHLIEGVLKGDAYYNYQKIKPYGFIILIVLLYLGVLDIILMPILRLVVSIIN